MPKERKEDQSLSRIETKDSQSLIDLKELERKIDEVNAKIFPKNKHIIIDHVKT